MQVSILPKDTCTCIHEPKEFTQVLCAASGGGTEIRSGRGAGVKGSEAADYPREASECEGQKLVGG